MKEFTRSLRLGNPHAQILWIALFKTTTGIESANLHDRRLGDRLPRPFDHPVPCFKVSNRSLLCMLTTKIHLQSNWAWIKNIDICNAAGYWMAQLQDILILDITAKAPDIPGVSFMTCPGSGSLGGLVICSCLRWPAAATIDRNLGPVTSANQAGNISEPGVRTCWEPNIPPWNTSPIDNNAV